MQPNQPYAPPPPQQTPEQNPYDFIMNSGEPVKKSPLGLPSGNSVLQRILIVGGGLVILLVVGIIAMSLLGGSGKSNSEQLLTLAQTQTEIMRVTDVILKQPATRSESTRILATNTALSVESTQKQVLAMIESSGKKVNTKELGLLKNAKTDTTLNTAALNNQYDDVATQVIITELKNYRTQLKTTYDGTSDQKNKVVLSDAFKGVGLLLGDTNTTTN